MLSLLLAMFVFVYLAPDIIVNITPGQGGVIWRRFGGGTDVNKVYTEGIKLILPWDRMYIYDTRLQATERTYTAISKDGLEIQVKITFRYHPIFLSLGYLHKHVGPRYVDVLLVPEIGAKVRHEISKVSSIDVYGPQREALQGRIFDAVVSLMNRNQIVAAGTSTVPARDPREPDFNERSDLGSLRQLDLNYVELTDILIREVTLPERVRAAIERKMEQDQLAQEYQYRLKRESMESARKEIEAKGIRKFQDIVQKGISENYLKWRGIEATLHLATSNNAKVVVIGSGENGLPLILNTADTNLAGGGGGAAGDNPLGGSLDSSREAGMNTLDQEQAGLNAAKVSPSEFGPRFPPPAGEEASERTEPAYQEPARQPPLNPALSPLVGVERSPDMLGEIARAFGGWADTERGMEQDEVPTVPPDEGMPAR
ncbi:prohibitin family protein [Endothiovibrio diazotrophicus]